MSPQTVQEYMQVMRTRFDPTAAEGLTAVYQFRLSGSPGGQYHLVVADGACAAQEGQHPKPNVTFAMSDKDCIGLFNGNLDGPSLYMQGRLKIEGDFELALRLPAMFPKPR